MLLNHPTDIGRTKNVPDELLEKFIDGGWTEAEDFEPEPDPEPEPEPDPDDLVEDED